MFSSGCDLGSGSVSLSPVGLGQVLPAVRVWASSDGASGGAPTALSWPTLVFLGQELEHLTPEWGPCPSIVCHLEVTGMQAQPLTWGPESALSQTPPRFYADKVGEARASPAEGVQEGACCWAAVTALPHLGHGSSTWPGCLHLVPAWWGWSHHRQSLCQNVSFRVRFDPVFFTIENMIWGRI